MRVAVSVSWLHFHLELYESKSWLNCIAVMRGEFVEIIVTFFIFVCFANRKLLSCIDDEDCFEACESPKCVRRLQPRTEMNRLADCITEENKYKSVSAEHK